MRSAIYAAMGAALAIALMTVGLSDANATGGGDHKTSICHRTASDTNPYVFETVDNASLQAHLSNGKGHFPKYWKSDGIWRGVAHVVGDPKNDYRASTAADCRDTTPPQTGFEPYKVAECFQVNKPDFSIPNRITDAEWLTGETWKSESKTDISLNLRTLCPAPPKCHRAKYQADLYLIDSQADENLLASIKKNGLSRKAGEHHSQDYSIVQSWNVGVKGRHGCTPPPPPPPPHVKKRHAHASAQVTDKCNCFMDKVRFFWNHDKVRGHVTHPNRTTWVAHLTGKKVGNVQYLLPNRINGSHGWAKHQRYVVHTTNKPCPCHKTHSCPRHGPPHHHCPTLTARLSKPCH